MKKEFDQSDLKWNLDGAGVVLKVEDKHLRVHRDYSFTEPGKNHIMAGTQVLFMATRFDETENSVWGFVLLSADPLKLSYERIGIAFNYLDCAFEKEDALSMRY
jgi:hypothetical protein